MSDPSLEFTSDDLFSFGVAELARAEPSRDSTPPAPVRVTGKPEKTRSMGFDPYNSSSAAPRKPWTALRKR